MDGNSRTRESGCQLHQENRLTAGTGKSSFPNFTERRWSMSTERTLPPKSLGDWQNYFRIYDE